MRAGWNPRLARYLRAADPRIAIMIEAETVEREDAKDVYADWSGADSTAGLTILGGPDGSGRPQGLPGAKLVSSGVTALDYSPTDDAAVEDLGPSASTAAIWVEWTGSNTEDFEVENVVLRLDPKITGDPREVEVWICKVYRVLGTGPDDDQVRIALIGEQQVRETGSVTHDVTFDLSRGGYASPAGGASPKKDTEEQGSTKGEEGSGGGTKQPSRPVTVVMLHALKDDGTAAGNCGWRALSGGGPTQTGSGWSATAYLAGAADNGKRAAGNVGSGGSWLLNSTLADFPWIQINRPSYSQATISFTSGNLIDLGGSPTGRLRIIAQGEEPSDSSITWEVWDSSTWVEVKDGDYLGETNTDPDGTVRDLTGVPIQQTYQVRATLDPSSTGQASPIARRLGVQEIAVTDLTGAAILDSVSGWGVDPMALQGEVTRASIKLLKTGERDYRDYATRLMSENHIGQMQFRVSVGHPELARADWLHLDTFDPDDFYAGDAALTVDALSVLGRLRTAGTIPPYDDVAEERVAVTYSGQTLKAVADDLLDSQIALPGRFRGPGIEDTSGTVSKVIREADGKDELDRLAYLAGFAFISSQGRVKAVKMFEDEGEERPPVAILPIEQVRPLNLGPGFATRMDEFFTRYGWDEEREEWSGEVRAFNGAWITKLRSRGLNSQSELDEETARWIDSQGLAETVSRRVVIHFGNGIMLWEVENTYPHPQLEPGDVVVVETDQFVARDPVTDREIRGAVSARGTVSQVMDPWGRRLRVWIKSFSDIVPSSVAVARKSFVRPRILDAEWAFTSAGALVFRPQANAGSGSVKAVADAAAFQGKSTVRAQAANATDADGWVEINLGGSYAVNADAYVSALAFEEASGGGAEQATLYKLKVTRPREGNLPEVHVWGVVTDDTADFFCEVDGDALHYDVDVDIYEGDRATGTLLVSHTFSADDTIGPADYAALDDRALPTKEHLRIYAYWTDALGNKGVALTLADRDALPGGQVIADDLRADAKLIGEYDDDTEQIVIRRPGGSGTAYTKSYSGLSGGGRITFTLGTTTMDDGVTTPSTLAEGGTSGDWTVEYTGGGYTIELWRGTLRGPRAGYEVRYAGVTYSSTQATIEDAEAFLDDDSSSQTLQYKDGSSAWADAPTNPDDITVSRPSAGSDPKEVLLAAKDGTKHRGQQSVTVQPQVASDDPELAYVGLWGAPEDDGTDLTYRVEWVALNAPSADYELDIDCYEGLTVEVSDNGVSTTASQPREITSVGGGGLSGPRSGKVRIQLIRKSDSAVMDDVTSNPVPFEGSSP